MSIDEESGGKNGMKAFVKTKEFKSLNIGFALDEGITTSDDTFLASFVDKRAWREYLQQIVKEIFHYNGCHN